MNISKWWALSDGGCSDIGRALALLTVLVAPGPPYGPLLDLGTGELDFPLPSSHAEWPQCLLDAEKVWRKAEQPYHRLADSVEGHAYQEIALSTAWKLGQAIHLLVGIRPRYVLVVVRCSQNNGVAW